MKADMRVEMIPVDAIRPDPQNPRTSADEQADAELTASIRLHGVKVPLICFRTAEGIVIEDGHRRWRCGKEAGKEAVPGIVYPKRPDEAELLLAQLTINAHRQNLNPIDEYEGFQRLATLQGWTPSQIAAGLAISNVEVTRVLSLGKLTAEERELIRAGKVSKSSGYALARIGQNERAGLAQKVAAGDLTRDRLDALARRKSTTERITNRRVCCAVPEGTVTVQTARGLNLGALIELLEGLAGRCRKLRSQKLDLSTALRVLRDQAVGLAAAEAIAPGNGQSG